MNIDPSLGQKTKTKTILKITGVVTGMVLSVLGLMETMGGFGNRGTVSILINQTKLIGSEFVNFPGANWVNEGEIHYQWDITNDGILGCGACESGVSFFNNRDQFPQTLTGTNSIELYDVSLENAGDLYVNQEVKIRNSFHFVEGQVITDKTLPSDYLHFVQPAVYSGDADNRHVNGYVGRTGTSPFVFPIGDGINLRPAGISGASASSFFKAAYFSGNPSSATLPVGAPFDTESKAEEVTGVQNVEYWDIRGSASTRITLYWDDQYQMPTFVTDLNHLIIVGWDGAKWVNLGQQQVVGSFASGRIESNSLIPDDYTVFTIGKADPSVFPVEWTFFTAERVDTDGHLHWVTSSEENSDRFEVERSLNSAFNDFTKIGEQPAQGYATTASSYEFIDPFITNLPVTRIYYRIKQIDFDGRFTYSPTRELNTERDQVEFQMNVYPNPAREFVMVKVGQGQSGRLQLQIIDMRGRLVFDSPVTAGEEKRINISSYAEGAYIVKIQDEESVYSKPLLKR